MLFDLIFFCFIIFGLICGMIAVSSKSQVLRVFMLIGLYFSALYFLLILGLEFLAFIILIVYLGAIAVLFLFIVMTHTSFSKRFKVTHTIWEVFLMFILSVPLLFFLLIRFYNLDIIHIPYKSSVIIPTAFEQLGLVLYTSHYLTLLFGGVLLLLALILVIQITKSCKK